MICKRSLDEPSYCRGTPALIFLLVAPLALMAALVFSTSRSASPAPLSPRAGGAAATAGDGRATAGLVPT